ncbi:PAS domain-containing protein [Kitasatospora arboriphila]
MVDEPNSAPTAGEAAGDPPSGVVALLRVAAVMVDPDGRIALWNRAAEELFGHRAEVACGRTASGLLPAVEPRPETGAPRPGTPPRRCDALDTLDDLTRPDAAWSGAMAVVDREERLRDVIWWAYPLVEPSAAACWRWPRTPGRCGPAGRG